MTELHSKMILGLVQDLVIYLILHWEKVSDGHSHSML